MTSDTGAAMGTGVNSAIRVALAGNIGRGGACTVSGRNGSTATSVRSANRVSKGNAGGVAVSYSTANRAIFAVSRDDNGAECNTRVAIGISTGWYCLAFLC